MKVTIKNNFDATIKPQADRIVEVEIPTADLIAELEKRRPCERCKPDIGCLGCRWHATHELTRSDNFKEAK